MNSATSIQDRLKGAKRCVGKAGAVPKLWFIDLDDTLFEASGGMLHAIHLRMNDFISKRLGLDWEAAGRLRTAYWAQYGSTFLGMWKRHRVDPREFLSATHDFDFLPFIHVEGDPKADLKGLPGRKVVLTNGPRNYADAVLAGLGMSDYFDEVITSSDMRLFGEWRPKPNAAMLRAVCTRFCVRPNEAVLVDDTLANLKCAKGVGLKTVWCTGYRRRNGKLSHRIDPLYVDASIVHIRELERCFQPCARLPQTGQPRRFLKRTV